MPDVPQSLTLARARLLARRLGGTIMGDSTRPHGLFTTRAHVALEVRWLYDLPAADAGITEIMARLGHSEIERFRLAQASDPAGAELHPVLFREEPPITPYALLSSMPSRTVHRFTPTIRRRLVALSPASLVSDGGEVVLRMPRLEADEERIEALIEILAELAGAPRTKMGAYR